MFQWRIQDFPQGGAPTPKIAIIFHIFAENCMKMKEFGPPGGGGGRGSRVPGAPPWIRQCVRYSPQRSCGKLIFSQACVNESCPLVWGVSASVHAGIHPPSRHTPWADIPGQTPTCQVHAGIHTRCMLGYTHPQPPPRPVHAGIDMATAADSTHPTGMHSCLGEFWLFFIEQVFTLPL